MPATDFLAPDEFADLLDAPEFKTLRPAQRAAVFDAGLKDSEEWLRQNDALDEPSWQQTAMALGNRYRPAEADIELDKQGPVGTAVNAFKNLGPDVVQGVIGGAAKMADAASEMVGLSDPNVPSWMDKTADFTEKIQQEGQIIRPLNPANPTAATIGSGAGQAVAMLGTAGASLPVLGARAMTAVPAAMGFAMGAGQGVDTAEDMGITSPAARLGMGTAFGAIEGATEMLGGIGGKFIPTPKGLAGMALAPFMEGGEEMLSQGFQDATTAGVGQFMSDPNRPGFTQNGYELPAFNAAMLERQKQAAIGGAAGGMVFAGLQALSPNDNVSPNQTPAPSGTPQAPGTTPATAAMAGAAGPVPSTLSRTAQESLVADLPEDTGALTAEEVEDLETANLPPTPTPTLPPSQTQPPMQGVGGGVRGGGGQPNASVTKDSGETADQTAQNTPGAGLSPATGAPLPAERSPEAQAYAEAVAQAAEATRQSQIAKLRQREAQAGRGPVIPDSPLGVYDILDFVNENKIRVPRADSAERKAGEYDWTETYSVPQYYRKFLGSSERGGSIDQVAQRAFENGFIREPTPDALMGAIQQGIDTRKQYKVQFAKRAQEQAVVEKQTLDFEKTQQTLRRKDKEQVRFEDIAPGDEMTIDGEQAVVKDVTYTEDGYLTNVVIEDGKRFGLMQFDPQTRSGLFVDEFTPKQRTSAEAVPEEPLFSRAAPRMDFSGLMQGAQAVASGAQAPNFPAALAGMISAPTPEARPAAPTPESGGARGVQRFFQPSLPPTSTPTLPPSQTQGVGGGVRGGERLRDAYREAVRGSGTQFATLSSVYSQARILDRTLTVDQFLTQVQDGYNNGTLYLEGAGSQQEAAQAGLALPGTNVGTAVRMMPAPQAEAPLRNAAGTKQQTPTVSSEGSRPVGRRIAAAADQNASQSTPKNGRDMLGSGPSKTDEANPDQASLEVKRAYQEISEWKEMAGRHLAHHQQQLAEMTASAGWQERRRTALNGESTSRSMLDAISDLQTRGSVSAFQHLLGRYTLPDGVAEAAMIYARRVSRDVLENQQVRESLDQEQRQQQAQMDALNRRWMPKWFPPSKPSATAQWWQDTLDELDAEARKPALAFISRIWRSIAKHPAAFQFGKTTSKSASDIAAAVSVPGKLVTARESGGTIRFSGKEGHLDIHDADTWEPYIRSTEAGSKGKQSGGGSQLYQAALDWIHNHGKTIKDDPAGITAINDVRRTSNFASSALRWGTTEHLQPHADQGVPWGKSAKLNTASLLTKEMDNAFKAVAQAKDWTYDFTRNEFLDSRGNTLSQADFSQAAIAANPGTSGIGMATLQRAVLTRSTLEAFQRGDTTQPLSKTSAGSDQLAEPLEGILYSPRELAANQKANEAILKNLGLPTAKGTRVWGASKVKAALAKLSTNMRYPATTRLMARELANLSLDNLLLKIEADARLNWAGLYQPFTDGRGELSLNTRTMGRGEQDIGISLVHEALHHATYRALRAPKTARQKQAKADLEALFKRAKAALAANEQLSAFDYELSSLDEFITGLWTRADFQTALAGIPLENASTLGQRVRSVLDEIFRVLAELVTMKDVPVGSVLEASMAATLRIMGDGKTQAQQEMNPMPLMNPAAEQRENRSRFASPEQEQRMYEPQGNDVMLAEAAQWLSTVDNATAVQQLESGNPPAGLRKDHLPALAEQTMQRLAATMTSDKELVRLQAEALLDRAGIAWQDVINREAGRGLQQVGAANVRLLPIAPILAVKRILVDRADAIMDKRFEGGAEGAVEKITNILNNVQGDITERVEAILNAVMGARLKPRVTIREAVAGLVNGKTQRDEMIDDVARALLQKAKSSQVKPEQKTALAALVASLKRTLGAAVRGTALKPDALSFGELLARTFVDQVAEAPMFEESWKAGREQVRLMLIELGMTESAALKRLNELMPATPTVAYAPGMVKQAVQRGFEAAGYGQTLATGADQSGQRAVDVRAEVLRNPQKAMAAVLRVWDAEAQAGGISPEAWAQGRQLAVRALNETLQQWQQQAAETTAKAAEATKNRLLAKDSPALAKLLKELTAKIAPGMTWTEIFTDMPSTQKARQKEIYRRLMLDERLRGLTQDERLALTNELDKAWMRERRKVFNKELEKAGVIGEKDKTDRVKVQKALPKLLRMINLGMFNSEMWRDAVAPQYGLRMLTSADTAQLRTLAEAAWKLPEGVLRNQKLRDMLNAMQKKTGASWIEVLNSYWTAAVLSGLRTQFDTWLAAVNGMGTNLMQIGGLIARGQGKAAIDAHAQWWRGLIEGVRESGQILFKGDTSYLKRFGADLMKALEGETSVTPVPLGENLWKNGNTFQKYGLAPVMMFTGRLMAAADHINNTATTQGAIAVARALNPELYEGKVGFTETERTNARAQALQEVTGGREPQTAQERATLSARVRELLNGSVNKQDYADSSEIGDMAAFQNDPTGVFGIIYSAMKQGLGSIQRGLGNYAEDVTANRFARVASGIMAGSLHGITGTRFMRFGANFGAEMTRYIPGSYVLGKAGFYGRNVSRMQQELLLGKNLVGLMIGSTLAAVFLAGDDDDEGWQIEGDWSTLTPQEAKARMAAGYERMTMWKRDGDKIRRVSYKQWPTMGLFSVVGGMLDEKRHKPAQWAAHGTSGHLLRGLATGYVQVKNVSAVRNLVELFGEPAFSADGVTGAIDKFVKTSSNFAGGLMPTLVKDADIWTDPRNFKPEGVAEQFLRSVPFARKFINDGRPQLNLLGEEVKLQRAPWSRAYTSVESAEAHRVLGALMARGLSLPMPSDQVHVIKDNVKVPLDTLGREAVYRYEKAVGQGYKDWLSLEGNDLLKMPVKDADARIKSRAEAIKARAKASVVR